MISSCDYATILTLSNGFIVVSPKSNPGGIAKVSEIWKKKKKMGRKTPSIIFVTDK